LTSSRTSSPNQNSSKMRVPRESLSIRSAAAKAYHLMARLPVASPRCEVLLRDMPVVSLWDISVAAQLRAHRQELT
jgi:hypothetical protein